MVAIKDDKRTWRVQIRYKEKSGNVIRKQKRGFKTKKEAQEWEDNFINSLETDINITFANLYNNYIEDISNRIRESTLKTKQTIIESQILDFFSAYKISDIKAIDVRKWQNTILKKGYSDTYVKTINNQLSAILNYAVRYYGLSSNPCHLAGSIGKKNADEMNFWTLDEYKKFISVIDKLQDKIVFEVLYWSGIRIGELLALTKSDLDFDNNVISISKNHVVVDSKHYTNEPKTPRGRRNIHMPSFVMGELREYIDSLYKLNDSDRIFPFARSYPLKLMNKYCPLSGVKKIRTHDLRHSHASLLVSMDVNITTIADRLGHENIETTWNTYSHLYPNKRQEVADKLNVAILSPKD